ncbi:hypothetical protein D3C85_90060 [compost metagenome]
MNNQPHVSEDEIPCDFSSIMDCAQTVIPNFTGGEPVRGIHVPDTYEPPKTFFEQYLADNPDVTFTQESVMKGMARAMVEMMGPENTKLAMQELKDRWAHVGKPTMPDPTTMMEDPVGDLIRHFGIFYEHVYLLEGYPKEAQPTLKELKLLGERIHKCLLNQDGTLNVENVKRCEDAHMSVTLDYGLASEPEQKNRGVFIQVVRGKAALRQKV